MKKPVLILVLSLLILPAGAQVKRKASRYNASSRENPFLQQQWWIGLKGGVNVSSVSIDKSYSVIVPTNYSTNASGKKYDAWKPFGTHIGLEANYFFRGFSISVQPLYTTIRFNYGNRYSWIDPETPSNHIDLNYEQEQRVSYVYVPLLLKYEMNLHGLIPYVQAGAYYAFLMDATKSVTVTGTDYASGGINPFEYEPVSVGAKDLFASAHFGFIGGAGLYYNIGNIRLNLDVQYRIGRTFINSTENRFSNDRLNGIGDAMDDMTVDNVAVSFGTLFPLRFLSSGFKSYDK